jgi:hypothetical protein
MKIGDVKNHRIRSRTEGPIEHTLTKYEDGNVFDQKTTVGYEKSEAIRDVVTEDFKLKINQGQIINNPCLYTSDQYRETGGGHYDGTMIYSPYKHYTTSGGSTTAYQRSFAVIPWLTTNDLAMGEDIEREREAKFHAIAHIDETPYAFAEDVGEVRETLKFLRRPFHSLLKLGRTFEKDVATRAIRKAKWLKMSETQARYALAHDTIYRAELIAAAWTEYRFAASPLVRSSMDALEAATFYEGVTPPQAKNRKGSCIGS